MVAPQAETWKPVVGYEGLYLVSDHGRVRSLQTYGRGKSTDVLRFYLHAGYPSVRLFRNKVGTRHRVHSLAGHALDRSPDSGGGRVSACPLFDGVTFNPRRDHARLAGQLDRVRAVVLDGQWRTLDEIGRLANAPAQSVSARLRDLRKVKFGGHEVRRKRGDAPGLWLYRVEVASE